MKNGKLIYQTDIDRMDIWLSRSEHYGGLHCGQAMDVEINGQWIPSRIEYGENWYLVGIQEKSIIGLTVRI